MIRIALINSLALTHSHTRSRWRTHAGSGERPPPNELRLP